MLKITEVHQGKYYDIKRYAPPTKMRVFFTPKGETIMENFLGGRHNRPYKEYRKFLPEVFEQMGVPADTTASWSQKAGCSMCPCSPGFVLSHRSYSAIWVTIEEVEE